jgi:hypothetical protein
MLRKICRDPCFEIEISDHTVHSHSSKLNQKRPEILGRRMGRLKRGDTGDGAEVGPTEGSEGEAIDTGYAGPEMVKLKVVQSKLVARSPLMETALELMVRRETTALQLEVLKLCSSSEKG